MSTSISLRLPDEIAQALDDLAKATDRPKSYIITKALKTYLEEYADYMIALDRLHDKDDEIISPQELRKRLGVRDRV